MLTKTNQEILGPRQFCIDKHGCKKGQRLQHGSNIRNEEAKYFVHIDSVIT